MSAIAAEPPLNVSALWRAARFPAVLVVIGLALVTILAAIGKAPNNLPLDPRNETSNGTHALAALLGDRGITVSIATSVAHLDSSNASTIVVAQPVDLSDRALATISTSSATVLLVDPLQHALSVFGIDATLDDTIADTTLGPGCQLAAAVTAGSARISGDLYAVQRGATACYLEAGDAALLESTRASGGRTIVLGSASTLTNANLAAGGDAALDLGLLTTPTVQWVPGGLGAGPVPKSQRGLLNLLPPRLPWATLQLFIAVVVLALWRARRLGRPVVEPLPVVVRAAETVEGRARMLHAAHARGAAAQSLRRAALRRLAHVLRLGPDEDPAAVAALVAERTHKPAAEINALLYGDEPSDDAALVQLAQELPQLETAVRGHDGGSPGGQQ
jgi:hypothetical protein